MLPSCRSGESRLLMRLPGVGCIPAQQVPVINEPVALQPRQRGFQFGQGYLGAALVAQHAFQNGVLAMVEPLPSRNLQVSSILHDLRGHYLADERRSGSSSTDGGSINSVWASSRSRRTLREGTQPYPSTARVWCSFPASRAAARDNAASRRRRKSTPETPMRPPVRQRRSRKASHNASLRG